MNLCHERRAELAFEFTDHLFDLEALASLIQLGNKSTHAAELNARPRVRNYVEGNPDSNLPSGTMLTIRARLPTKTT